MRRPASERACTLHPVTNDFQRDCGNGNNVNRNPSTISHSGNIMRQSRCHCQSWDVLTPKVPFPAALDPRNSLQRKHLAHAERLENMGSRRFFRTIVTCMDVTAMHRWSETHSTSENLFTGKNFSLRTREAVGCWTPIPKATASLPGPALSECARRQETLTASNQASERTPLGRRSWQMNV
jgi:hypothetical protein